MKWVGAPHRQPHDHAGQAAAHDRGCRIAERGERAAALGSRGRRPAGQRAAQALVGHEEDRVAGRLARHSRADAAAQPGHACAAAAPRCPPALPVQGRTGRISRTTQPHQGVSLGDESAWWWAGKLGSAKVELGIRTLRREQVAHARRRARIWGGRGLAAADRALPADLQATLRPRADTGARVRRRRAAPLCLPRAGARMQTRPARAGACCATRPRQR